MRLCSKRQSVPQKKEAKTKSQSQKLTASNHPVFVVWHTYRYITVT